MRRQTRSFFTRSGAVKRSGNKTGTSEPFWVVTYIQQDRYHSYQMRIRFLFPA